MSAKKTAKTKPETKAKAQAPDAAPPADVAKATKAKKDKPKKVSAIDAAARVLGEAKEPMTCPEMIKTMAEKGYWTSPGGATPHATLYTAVTELPNLAPGGAVSKRAWADPVGDSDMLVLDLDRFHEATNDLAASLKVGLVESSPNLIGEVFKLCENQPQFVAAGRQICCRCGFLL
jgi:hypothetical protein